MSEEKEPIIPIQCHAHDFYAQAGDSFPKHHCEPDPEAESPFMHWCKPDSDRPFRHCSYCGSMHPLDLLAGLEQGARLGGSDWKYGWPHKFYVYDYPNTGKYSMFKWYNKHLLDLDTDLFTKLAALLDTHAHILFERKEGDAGLYYRAPYAGYQKA